METETKQGKDSWCACWKKECESCYQFFTNEVSDWYQSSWYPDIQRWRDTEKLAIRLFWGRLRRFLRLQLKSTKNQEVWVYSGAGGEGRGHQCSAWEDGRRGEVPPFAEHGHTWESKPWQQDLEPRRSCFKSRSEVLGPQCWWPWRAAPEHPLARGSCLPLFFVAGEVGLRNVLKLHLIKLKNLYNSPSSGQLCLALTDSSTLLLPSSSSLGNHVGLNSSPQHGQGQVKAPKPPFSLTITSARLDKGSLPCRCSPSLKQPEREMFPHKQMELPALPPWWGKKR